MVRPPPSQRKLPLIWRVCGSSSIQTPNGCRRGQGAQARHSAGGAGLVRRWWVATAVRKSFGVGGLAGAATNLLLQLGETGGPGPGVLDKSLVALSQLQQPCRAATQAGVVCKSTTVPVTVSPRRASPAAATKPGLSIPTLWR